MTDSTPLSSPFTLRPATEGDVQAIVGLIGELADFEHLTHLMRITPQDLRRDLFGERRFAEALVVQQDEAVIAFALFFHNYSTFLGRPGLYLEDLYVQPAHRGRGVGTAVLRHLGALAVERGCGRFEWSVLDWNVNAIGFYEKMGATVMPEWRICRVTGDALQAFAAGTSDAADAAARRE